MQSLSPSPRPAVGFESAICHVPVLSVTVLGAVGTLSSLAEGLSVLKLIWPEVLSNYHFVVLQSLASWCYIHAFWLNNLIHLEKWEGKERSGKPPGSYNRKKAFVHPESLQEKTAKYCISSSPETSLLLPWSAVMEQIKMLMLLCHIPAQV